MKEASSTAQPAASTHVRGARAPSSGLLKSVTWFPFVPGSTPESGIGSALTKLAIGGLVGLVFFLTDRPSAAYVVWGIAGTVGAISIGSLGARAAINRALARVAQSAGTGVGVVLLSIIYIGIVTPARYVRQLLGTDDLHLRDRGRVSYWIPVDSDKRKRRWVGAMFATEASTGRTGNPLRTTFVLFLVMLALAEGVARLRGFGHAVLYHADPIVGYYPSPNQHIARYGGALRTNPFGMRSEDITARKAFGNFRVLMLGDSTQWGGSYVDQDDVYSTRIQKAFNELCGSGKVEVLAMGANGWGPFHERGYVKKFGTFDADVAVIDLPMDDINRPLYGLMDAPFFGDLKPPTFALEEFLNNLAWRYRKSHAGLGATWEAEQSPLGIEEYGRLADDLHRSIREVYGAVLPGRSAGMGGVPDDASYQWFDRLHATFDAHDVITTYPRGLFAGKGTPDEIYYDDVHLNPKGHEIYAAFLFDELKNGATFKEWLGGGKVAAHVGGQEPATGKP